MRDDYRAGQICAVIANVNIDHKKHKSLTAGDFFHIPEVQKPKQSAEDMLRVVQRWQALYESKDKR